MNRVARNATWIIACKIVQSVLALIINMFTARYLGPSNYGLITYASSLAAFALPIMQLGLTNILVQEIVNHPDHEGKTLGTSMACSMCSAVFCIIGITVFALIANHDEPITIIVCVLYSFTLLFQATEMLVYWFQAKLFSKYTSIVSLVAYVIVSCYKIYLLASAKNVYWFAFSNAFDFFLITIGIFIVYKKLDGQKLSFSWDVAKRMFSRSKHYILSSMMVMVFAQTDKIMLKLMINETETGLYGAAVFCAGLTNFIFTAIIDSFRPPLFEGRKENSSIFEHRLTILYSIIIYLSLLQSIGMTLLANVIIRVMYGSAYQPAGLALRIVVWYSTFSYLGSVRNIWILANEQQHHLWKINLCGALANVVLNILFIPILGLYGAAIASLITQFFTNVIVGYMIKEIRPNNAIMIKGLNPRYLMLALNSLKRKKESV